MFQASSVEVPISHRSWVTAQLGDTVNWFPITLERKKIRWQKSRSLLLFAPLVTLSASYEHLCPQHNVVRLLSINRTQTARQQISSALEGSWSFCHFAECLTSIVRCFWFLDAIRWWVIVVIHPASVQCMLLVSVCPPLCVLDWPVYLTLDKTATPSTRSPSVVW